MNHRELDSIRVAIVDGQLVKCFKDRASEIAFRTEVASELPFRVSKSDIENDDRDIYVNDERIFSAAVLAE